MDNYLRTLKEIFEHPKKPGADFCRYHAYLIAEMATRRHIGFAAGRWYVSRRGTAFLQANLGKGAWS